MFSIERLFFHKAIVDGNIRAVERLLLEGNIDPNSSSGAPEVAPIKAYKDALQNRQYEIADLILKFNVYNNTTPYIPEGATSEQGSTYSSPEELSVSDFLNDIEALKILLKHGAKISQQDVEHATDYETCKLLLEHYPRSLSDFTDEHGNIIQSYGNNKAITEAITERAELLRILTKAVPDADELKAFIAKHPACINWQLYSERVTYFADYASTMAELLIDYITPIKIAAMEANHNFIDILLENGADINHITDVIKIKRHNTALSVIDVSNHTYPKLLEHPDLDFFYFFCNTDDTLPRKQFNNLIKKSDLETVEGIRAIEELLEQHPTLVDFSIIDKNGYPIKPVDLAIKNGNLELLTLLLDRGAKINVKTFETLAKRTYIDQNMDSMMQLLLNSPNFKPEYLSPKFADHLIPKIDISFETTKLIVEKTNLRIPMDFLGLETEKFNFISHKFQAQCRSDYFEDMVLYADFKTQALNIFTIIAPIALTYIASQISESYGPAVSAGLCFGIAYINKDNNIKTHASFFALETMAMTAISYCMQSDNMVAQVAFGVAAAASMALAAYNVNDAAKEYDYQIDLMTSR